MTAAVLHACTWLLATLRALPRSVAQASPQRKGSQVGECPHPLNPAPACEGGLLLPLCSSWALAHSWHQRVQHGEFLRPAAAQGRRTSTAAQRLADDPDEALPPLPGSTAAATYPSAHIGRLRRIHAALRLVCDWPPDHSAAEAGQNLAQAAEALRKLAPVSVSIISAAPPAVRPQLASRLRKEEAACARQMAAAARVCKPHLTTHQALVVLVSLLALNPSSHAGAAQQGAEQVAENGGTDVITRVHSLNARGNSTRDLTQCALALRDHILQLLHQQPLHSSREALLLLRGLSRAHTVLGVPLSPVQQ